MKMAGDVARNYRRGTLAITGNTAENYRGTLQNYQGRWAKVPGTTLDIPGNTAAIYQGRCA